MKSLMLDLLQVLASDASRDAILPYVKIFQVLLRYETPSALIVIAPLSADLVSRIRGIVASSYKELQSLPLHLLRAVHSAARGQI